MVEIVTEKNCGKIVESISVGNNAGHSVKLVLVKGDKTMIIYLAADDATAVRDAITNEIKQLK